MKRFCARRFWLMPFLAALLWSAVPPKALAQSVGEPAPEFSALTQGGEELTLSELQGSVVVLNFWASWCGPCRKELPFLGDFYEEQHENGIEILAINVDSEAGAMEAFIESVDFEIPFSVIADAEGGLPAQYDIPGMPTVVFIDKQGTIRYVHSGFRSSYEEKYRSELLQLMLESE